MRGRLSPRTLAIAAILLVAVVLAGAALVAGGDDTDNAPALTGEDARKGSDDLLDDLFPDRATPVADAEPTPTADPTGSEAAADELLVAETLWATNGFGELDVVVLVQNGGAQAYANVVVEVAVLDRAGAALEVVELAVSRVEPAHIVPVTAQLALDVDAVDAVDVVVRARGTVPPRATTRVDDVSWSTDDLGTTVVSGTIDAPELVEFVAVVAILRDGDRDYVGFAFGFVDGVDPTQRRWEATGFPSGEVAAVDVFTTG